MTSSPCIIVHGGVEESDDYPMIVERMLSCRKAACIGYEKLINGERSAIEAVESALRWFEDDELFNCGYGSVLNQIGDVQMDSSIMNGLTLECGSVVAVSKVDHPISLAKYVMETSPNSILYNEAARKLVSKVNGVIEVSPGNIISPDAYKAFVSSTTGNFGVRIFQDSADDYGLPSNLDRVDRVDSETVGCVAWDGKLMVSGSTTGGLNRKLLGRVGDSALCGCGIFADGLFGCSITGHGESAIAFGFAREMAARKKCGLAVNEALEEVLEKMFASTGKMAGVIGLASDGSWATCFTGSRMPFSFINERSIICGKDRQHYTACSHG